MSTITLDQITAAAATIADEPKAQGEAMAAIILELSKPVSTPVSTPTIARKRTSRKARKAKPTIAPVAATPTIAKGDKSPNWKGQMMLSGKGTATNGQVKWLVSNGVKPATAKKLSMVAASNMRAKLTGKIA